MDATGAVQVDLTEDERYLLTRGLAEWGGPASPTDELARAMGFLDCEDLRRGRGRQLRESLGRGEHLSREDWRRTLLATEIVFASAIVGAGWDWRITTGLSDEDSIKRLRSIQRKISGALRQAQAPTGGRQGGRRLDR